MEEFQISAKSDKISPSMGQITKIPYSQTFPHANGGISKLIQNGQRKSVTNFPTDTG